MSDDWGQSRSTSVGQTTVIAFLTYWNKEMYVYEMDKLGWLICIVYMLSVVMEQAKIHHAHLTVNFCKTAIYLFERTPIISEK